MGLVSVVPHAGDNSEIGQGYIPEEEEGKSAEYCIGQSKLSFRVLRLYSVNWPDKKPPRQPLSFDKVVIFTADITAKHYMHNLYLYTQSI